MTTKTRLTIVFNESVYPSVHNFYSALFGLSKKITKRNTIQRKVILSEVNSDLESNYQVFRYLDGSLTSTALVVEFEGELSLENLEGIREALAYVNEDRTSELKIKKVISELITSDIREFSI